MKFASALAVVFLTSCSSSSTASAPVHRGSACTPAPLPSPAVMLVSPSPNQTSVSTTTASISVSTIGLVTAIDISPAVDGTQTISSVSAAGTPGPNGVQTYAVPLPGALAAGTTYTISANVTLDPTNCPQTFVVNAGSFST